MVFPLPTDFLVWLLVAAVGMFIWYCARRPHLAAPWARVFRSRAAIASAVFLSFYLGIGLLDSLHYRPALASNDANAAAVYGVEVRSLLDTALASLREGPERRESPPVATRLFQKEQVELPDGKSVRKFPRLRYGGPHLEDEADAGRDIALRTLAGLAGGLVVWMIVFAFTGKSLRRRWPQIPWAAAFAALA